MFNKIFMPVLFTFIFCITGTVAAEVNPNYITQRVQSVSKIETGDCTNEIKKILKASCGCSQYPDEVKEDCEKENYINALSGLNKILKENPNDLKALNAKADILALTNSEDEAIKITSDLIAANPQDGCLYYKRALYRCLNIKTDKKTLLQIKDDLDKAFDLKFSPAQFFIVRGQINEMLRQYKNAQNDYTMYLEKNVQPELGAYFKRANTFYLDKKYDKAIRDYDTIIQIDPQFTSAYLNRGFVKFMAGDYKGSITDFEYVVKNFNSIKGRASECVFDPQTFADICPIMAYKCFSFTALEESISQLAQDEVLFVYASALSKIKDFQKAYEIYEKLAKETPRDFRPLLAMGYINYANSNDNVAAYYFNEALKNNNTYKVLSSKGVSDIYTLLATACLVQRDYNGAYDAYSDALKYRPDDWELYYKRAKVKYASQEFKDAISDLNKAIKINPKSEELLCVRGGLLGREGKYEEAIQDFTNAVAINPQYANAYFSRAIAYESLEEREKSLEDAKKAKELYEQTGNEQAANSVKEIITRLENKT